MLCAYYAESVFQNWYQHVAKISHLAPPYGLFRSTVTRLELCLTRHHRRFDATTFDGVLNVFMPVTCFFNATFRFV